MKKYFQDDIINMLKSLTDETSAVSFTRKKCYLASTYLNTFIYFFMLINKHDKYYSILFFNFVVMNMF